MSFYRHRQWNNMDHTKDSGGITQANLLVQNVMVAMGSTYINLLYMKLIILPISVFIFCYKHVDVLLLTIITINSKVEECYLDNYFEYDKNFKMTASFLCNNKESSCVWFIIRNYISTVHPRTDKNIDSKLLIDQNNTNDTCNTGNVLLNMNNSSKLDVAMSDLFS